MSQLPVAHTSSTLNDHYLRRDAGAKGVYQSVVGKALTEEVVRLQSVAKVRTLSERELESARRDPATAAQRLGIKPEQLRSLVEGRLDTIATACADNLHGPSTPAGEACRASFLVCLSCDNAWSEPRLIPAQALMSERIWARRKEILPQEWERRYGEPYAQLQDLLTRQGKTAGEEAGRASADQLEAIEMLLDGRLDLR